MIRLKKIFLVIAVSILFYNNCTAQKNPSFFKAAKYATALKIGLLNGEASKPGAELQLVSGLSSKTWFAGIGSGLDYYSDFKSVPVFLNVRKDINEKKNTPFINADIGYNFPLKNKINQSWVKYKYESGLYYALGAGYKFSLTNLLGLALSAGYSFKTFKEKDYYQSGFDPVDHPLPPQIETLDYKFRRISIRLDFWF
jgi:hypothetical protein